MQFNRAMKAVTPPVVWDAARKLSDRLLGRDMRFDGDYACWAEAAAAAHGYDAAEILQRNIEATRKVCNGEAAFERDGVAFGDMQPNFPLAWALARALARHGRLHVLDFGGSLGSTFHQARVMLPQAADVRWAVVDQAGQVEAGLSEFATDELAFHHSIEAAKCGTDFDVLLLSGSLQYLPKPFELLEQILPEDWQTIILDRMPFMVDGTTRLTVQHVPASIGAASYPAWFFSEAQVLARLERDYHRIADWPGKDSAHNLGRRAVYKGLLFERKTFS